MAPRVSQRRWQMAFFGLALGKSIAFLSPRMRPALLASALGNVAAVAKATSAGFLLPETKLPTWTPPWASLPAMVQVGIFLGLLGLVAAVLPVFFGQGLFGQELPKAPEPEPEPPKPEMRLGVTDELFDPQKRRQRVFQTEAAAAATADQRVEEAAEAVEAATAEEPSGEQRGSAWERLKEGL
ncbi:Uncharacterized protein SCF082_LOCUS20534 [Durusdinium trenchii]|uniref:Uncharacterized protein n=1 Tax=Durusdinium trenchii TaxID=1381693 RepID=A0ABP0L5R1_9DINO